MISKKEKIFYSEHKKYFMTVWERIIFCFLPTYKKSVDGNVTITTKKFRNNLYCKIYCKVKIMGRR